MYEQETESSLLIRQWEYYSHHLGNLRTLVHMYLSWVNVIGVELNDHGDCYASGNHRPGLELEGSTWVWGRWSLGQHSVAAIDPSTMILGLQTSTGILPDRRILGEGGPGYESKCSGYEQEEQYYAK